jgi:hypothetical protein
MSGHPSFAAVYAVQWLAKHGFQRLGCGHTVPPRHFTITVGEVVCCSEECARKIEVEFPCQSCHHGEAMHIRGRALCVAGTPRCTCTNYVAAPLPSTVPSETPK